MSKRRSSNKSNKRIRQAQQIQEVDYTPQEPKFDDWKLDDFEPEGRQWDIVESLDSNWFTIVDASSGCGKTSTALWAALNHLVDPNDYDTRQLIFIKNPTEVGDDKIGFLSGSETDKLQAHYETTKRIFDQFVDKTKLEYEIKRERIRLTIPNFCLGATFDRAIVILDEAQLASPMTVKLLMERAGAGTRYLILGDSNQTYAISRRDNGFQDIISRVTDGEESLFPGMFGYVKLRGSEYNKRSEASKFIVGLYEGEYDDDNRSM